MDNLRKFSIVLVAALISSCSFGNGTPEASPSTPKASVSSSAIPSPFMSSPVAQLGIDLDPIPYFFAPADATSQNLPDWMSKLSTSQNSESVAAEYEALGVSSVVSVNYAPEQGEPVTCLQFSTCLRKFMKASKAWKGF